MNDAPPAGLDEEILPRRRQGRRGIINPSLSQNLFLVFLQQNIQDRIVLFFLPFFLHFADQKVSLSDGISWDIIRMQFLLSMPFLGGDLIP